MTLKDLLFSFCNDGEESYGTILDTDDESFPKEYRHRSIYYAELFYHIRKANDDSFLNRKVKSISFQPQRHTIPSSKLEEKGITTENIFDVYPIRYNMTTGFLIEDSDPVFRVIDDGNRNIERVVVPNKVVYHLAPVLKIILEKEKEENEI